jgi:hypothetical protein
MVRSADLSTAEIGPNAVAGSVSSAAVRPVKCTSPAKASVMAAAAALAGRPRLAAGDGRGKLGEGRAAGATGPHAASAAAMTRNKLTSIRLADIRQG